MTATSGAIPPILLVGCGRMGSAMLSGWREQGLAPSVAVDPAESAKAFAGPDLTVVGDPADIPENFAPAAIVLAVKPPRRCRPTSASPPIPSSSPSWPAAPSPASPP